VAVLVAHQALLITVAAQRLQAITAALAVPALASLIRLLCARVAATTLLMAVRNGWVPMRRVADRARVLGLVGVALARAVVLVLVAQLAAARAWVRVLAAVAVVPVQAPAQRLAAAVLASTAAKTAMAAAVVMSQRAATAGRR